MKTFNIKRPDQAIRQDLIDRINNLAKPKGSLGTLEELALQIGLIQQTLSPQLHKPHNIIFAADHGIADEGVSFSPKEVTWQVINNFLGGGAGINFLCRQHGFELVLVDGGIDFDFPEGLDIIDRKVRKGTRNYLHEAALTQEEMEQAVEAGAEVVRSCHDRDCNVVSFGEMGVANTSTSSMWMSFLTGIDLKDCVGAGSGLDSEGVRHKYNILKQAKENYTGNGSAEDIITYFGGLEMLMAVGGMLQAAELGMLIIVDGFIMTNCLLAASQFYPEVRDYAVFGHCGDEAGHVRLLKYMQAKPLLNLGLRLGEGSGAVCSYPIIVSAVSMINEMHTFAQAAVTKYF
ncbi:nicotinate-nucleotide--dimethylbenzimidazole phosphoribosyltransferase [Porphyromonas gulae]|uniref:nicotinate-nucleotide--dimethylbenzimidazole phosphoribosyltransferase n=1 Tax=Porphyromonas gulae TaxID=111105 RepID=UPI0026F044F5|nr:nicotinate-nucleotide--dimethylbenzimidazole phosphoribosyltransferase [Porphyromonas gulae]